MRSGTDPTKIQFILASQSPRRRALLETIGLPVRIVPSDIGEHPVAGETPAAMVSRLSALKALAVSSEHAAAIVIGADTTVAVDGDVLGKPVNGDEAVQMLERLSGRWHTVFSGVSLARDGKLVGTRVASTKVRMRRYDRDIARRYAATGEPLDKAGAYGIQGFGALMVAEIRGSYDTVVGLPLREIGDILEEAGLAIWDLLCQH